MKNILLLTSIYPLPNPENRGTSVCHYFAREWIKMGYNVKVIHFQTVYPFFFYWAAKLFRNIIESRTGAVVYTKRDKGDKQYDMDGVRVYRYPIFKIIPHGKYFQRTIRNKIYKIVKMCSQDNFIPDVIAGHFPNPQLSIVNNLKSFYPNACTSIVMHGDIDQIKLSYKNTYHYLMENIDIWGFRSKSIQKEFEKVFGKKKNSFICYSGIPENYLKTPNMNDYSGNLKNFIYVGELIKRKYPIALVRSIPKIYSNKNYHITYVGSGAEMNSIKSEVEQFGISDKVSFTGKIPRSDIQNYLDNSDCLIMISKGEAFGLVYLEAMARGCITIGSRNEGIEGIIENGINGFLCEAGNEIELTEIIKHITSLTTEERKVISRNAIVTAGELTDYKAAENYIKTVMSCKTFPLKN